MYKKTLFIIMFIFLLAGCSGAGNAKEAMAEIKETPKPTNSLVSVTAKPVASPSLTPIPAGSQRPTASPTRSPSPVPVLKENLSDKALSPLTGLFIDKDIAVRRPYAVVVNNIRKALPQSGIGQAEVMYEVLAEGDITRLIAIFQEFDSEKIGPVRSARDYFVDFALDNDAFFVHHGGSPGGYTAVKTLGINNFDGMALEGVTFWRDKNRLNQPGMYEHSSYTDTEKLLATTEKRGLRSVLNEASSGMFSFYAIALSPNNGQSASKITVPFSKNYTSVFEYDRESRLYKKFQGVDMHIDEETGEQLSYTNVIIQFADMHIIPGDDAGRRHVGIIGSGGGYVITNGKYAPITWEKSGHSSATKWYDEFGNELKINKGKTWICVFDGEPVFE